MTIYRGTGGGGNATTDSEIALLTQLEQSATAAAATASTAATTATTKAAEAAASAASITGDVADAEAARIAAEAAQEGAEEAQDAALAAQVAAEAAQAASEAAAEALENVYTKTEADAGFVAKTGATGAAVIPNGTTAQRPTAATGQFRFNTSLGKFEGYNGTAWGAVGGGATGGGSDDIFIENSQTVTTNYTITTGKNAMSAGPVTVNSGVTVTVPSGSTWTIV